MLKNRLVSIVLLLIGAMSVVLTLDATVLIFLMLIAVPLFFEKKDMIG